MFTALHKESGMVKTWSLVTGKLIPKKTHNIRNCGDTGFDYDALKNYSIYEKNSKDNTYKEAKYMFPTVSYQLLMEDEPKKDQANESG